MFHCQNKGSIHRGLTICSRYLLPYCCHLVLPNYVSIYTSIQLSLPKWHFPKNNPPIIHFQDISPCQTCSLSIFSAVCSHQADNNHLQQLHRPFQSTSLFPLFSNSSKLFAFLSFFFFFHQPFPFHFSSFSHSVEKWLRNTIILRSTRNTFTHG